MLFGLHREWIANGMACHARNNPIASAAMIRFMRVLFYRGNSVAKEDGEYLSLAPCASRLRPPQPLFQIHCLRRAHCRHVPVMRLAQLAQRLIKLSRIA